MKTMLSLVFAGIFCLSSFSSYSQTTSKQKASLSYLMKYNGKTPYDVKLLKNAALAARLKKITGTDYGKLQQLWNVEFPMTVHNGVFKATACKQHDCDATNAIIVFESAKNILSAGIKQGGKVKLYSEQKGHEPAAMQGWKSGNLE